MLPNERFALGCRAWYEEQGLVVDASNGQFAHCPQPERYGDAGYYLLWEHHQHQGLLQSKDIGECCFFVGHAKKWLEELDYFPENYFELWDIYEEYAQVLASKTNNIIHSEKDSFGRSVTAVKAGASTHSKKDELGRSVHGVKAAEKLNSIKDENGKSLYGVNNVRKMHAVTHSEKNSNGKSVHAVKCGKSTHKEKDELGRSINAVRMAAKCHEERDEFGRSLRALEWHSEKDELGRSIRAMKTNNQVWESTVDGFRSNAGGVASHNLAKGWDPNARIKIS
jgi:hypothetical protein